MGEDETKVIGKGQRATYFLGGGLLGALVGVFVGKILLMVAIGLAMGIIVGTEVEKKSLQAQ